MIFIIDRDTKEIVKRVHPLSSSYEEIINDLDTELYACYEADEAFKSPSISDDGEVTDEAGEKPSEYHIWDEENSEWTIPDEILDPLKEKLKEDITSYRDSMRETSTVEYDGHLQRYRKSDIADINYYQSRLEKAQESAQEAEDDLAIEEDREAEEITLTMTWYFYDGTTAEMGVNDFDDLLELTDDPIEELYRKEAILKADVEAFETVEELESYDVATNWDNA